ncbi:MAG: hypothetical protein EBS81_13040, partial [Gammaproteobacteria bacterium]|nr:hypothetical protein [Gammaproteobacteria bacterium]
YATSSAAASSGTYDDRSGILTFNPGETSKSVAINIKDDNIYNPEAKAFTFGISNGNNGTIVDAAVVVSISENESEPTISAGDITLTEGEIGNIRISLSGPQATDRDIFIGTRDGTATTADYSARAETLTIPALATEIQVSVITTQDTIYEGTEQFYLDLGGEVKEAEAVVTINDDDEAPAIAFADTEVQVTEGNSAEFVINRLADSAIDLTFDVVVSSIDAEAEDYGVPEVLTLTIPASASTTALTLTTSDDAVDEFAESIALTLANPVDARLGGVTSSRLVINDNDDEPSLTIAPVTASVTEGDEVPISFTIDAASEKPISFEYVTLAGTAAVNSEYEFASGSISLAPGETSSSISVVTLDDAIDEED